LPDRMIGIGPRSTSISDSNVTKLAAQLGMTLCTPTSYKKMADTIIADITDGEARYTIPPKSMGLPLVKKPRFDLSLKQMEWVRGCLTALPRRVKASLYRPGAQQEGRVSPTDRGAAGPCVGGPRMQGEADLTIGEGVGEACNLTERL
jgi:hypothetical protein